ncbi:hypothetical protein H5T89_00140, partial [bacterium]|nr:hypothetical protein [bacterium]
YNTTVSILSDNSILAQRNISLFIARDDIMVSKSEDITLEGENILVRFARSGDSFSSVLFYGKTGDRLTFLSVIHPISRLIYINKGKEVNEVISPNINTLENNKVVLKYSSNLYDFQVTFKLSSKETIDVSYVLRPKEEIKILRFDGPWLRIGERSWGVTRKSALFPGLEWLEGEERSSNTLDVIEPYNLRLVPNPYKITTPAIGIELDKYLVGLLWKDNTQLSTIFCSPNWYEGQDNHLVGLFLPSVSEFVKENETTAFVPYKTYKGETLNINSKILVIPNGTVLDLVPKWLNLYGSLDYSFPRNYKEEIILCREGYKNIWDPNVCGWKHATPGNWNAERYPKDIFLLLLDYALTKDKDALNMANNALAQLT